MKTEKKKAIEKIGEWIERKRFIHKSSSAESFTPREWFKERSKEREN